MHFVLAPSAPVDTSCYVCGTVISVGDSVRPETSEGWSCWQCLCGEYRTKSNKVRCELPPDHLGSPVHAGRGQTGRWYTWEILDKEEG